MKMNLSRAAKKLREQMPQVPVAPKRAEAKKKSETPPAPPPVPVPDPVAETVASVEPLPEPAAEVLAVAEVPAPPVQKTKPVKVKRPRFVREEAEKRERAEAPALPPRSSKPAARLLTQKLAIPPKDEGNTGRNAGRR